MKITKTASGKQKLKLSKKEWQNMGRKAGWIKTSWNDEYKSESLEYLRELKTPALEETGPPDPIEDSEYVPSITFDGVLKQLNKEWYYTEKRRDKEPPLPPRQLIEWEDNQALGSIGNTAAINFGLQPDLFEASDGTVEASISYYNDETGHGPEWHKEFKSVDEALAELFGLFDD